MYNIRSLAPEARTRLETMVEVLRHWSKAINLVGRATLDDIWARHVLDSAQLDPLIPPGTKKLADLGSGAGFPGLVVAAMRPEIEVTLVESDARKAAYLGEASRRMELAIPPKVVIGRIEEINPLGADVVAARALAPLATLLEWAFRHRSGPAICLFHKGKGWRGELTEAMRDWDIPHQPFASVTDSDSVILRVGDYQRLASAGAAAADVRDRQPKGRRR